MALNKLIERIAAGVSAVPGRADIIALRQHSLDELQRRARRFVATVGEAYHLPIGRSDWIEREERTLIRLPQGSRDAYDAPFSVREGSGGRDGFAAELPLICYPMAGWGRCAVSLSPMSSTKIGGANLIPIESRQPVVGCGAYQGRFTVAKNCVTCGSTRSLRKWVSPWPRPGKEKKVTFGITAAHSLF